MGQPIVIQPRKSQWEGMLMQMYLTKYAHNLKMKQDASDRETASLLLSEKRLYEKQKLGEATRQGYLDEGRTPISNPEAVGAYPGEDGVTQNVSTGQIYSAPTPEQVTYGDKFVEKFDKTTGKTALQNMPTEPVGEWKSWMDPSDRTKMPKNVLKGTRPPKGWVPYEALDSADGSIPEIATKLRKEFIGQSNDFVKIRNAFEKVKVSDKDVSPAGDLSLIFQYMRILDPNSVVRESEFATASNTGSVPQRVWSQYNKVLKGERLSEPMRADFVKKAGQLYNAQETLHKQLASDYDSKATLYGVPRASVIIDYMLREPQNTEPQTGEPQAGDNVMQPARGYTVPDQQLQRTGTPKGKYTIRKVQ